MNTAGQMGVANRDFRRIGRKALSSGRTLVLLEARASSTKPTAKKPSILSWYTFKKWHLAIPVAIFLVVAGGYGAGAYMHSQEIAKKKAAAAAENVRARSVLQKSEACRQQKMKEKAASIGTLTYDQLYDNGACDF
jgi:hypothetical protein